ARVLRPSPRMPLPRLELWARWDARARAEVAGLRNARLRRARAEARGAGNLSRLRLRAPGWRRAERRRDDGPLRGGDRRLRARAPHPQRARHAAAAARQLEE